MAVRAGISTCCARPGDCRPSARRESDMMAHDEWLLAGAEKNTQSVTSDWQFVNQEAIAGVVLKLVQNVPTPYGHLTEVYRRDWGLDAGPVDQVFQLTLGPGSVSAWHAHEHTTDRLFVNRGLIRIVLYYARRDSTTFGRINEFTCGTIRPCLLLIPPRVWHGVLNLGNEPANLLNLVDRAYRYDDPDHWRLPPDSPEIPYKLW